MSGKRLKAKAAKPRWTGKRLALLLFALLLLGVGIGLYLWRGRPMLFGTLLCGGLAVWCGLWAVSRSRLFHGILLGLVCFGLAAFALLEGLVIANSRDDIHGQPETIVVLGAAVWKSGPSPMMRYRCNEALAYWNEHPEMTIVVSGGKGDGEYDSEANVMKEYLVEKGVPEESILLEDQSFNTLQNLRNTKALLEEQGISTENLLVVSNGYHLCRVKLLASRLGLEISTLSAPSTEPVSRIYFYARESLGLVKSFLMDR